MVVWLAVGLVSGGQAQPGETEPSRTNRLEAELSAPLKLTGMVRDGNGTALAGVEVVLWPGWRANAKGAKTDDSGRFTLAWSPQRQASAGFGLFVIARDLKRNLAVAQAMDEDTTSVELRLEPGLTLRGRATDSQGKPLSNAVASLVFWADNMVAPLGEQARTDANGRFELTGLPAGHRYQADVTAKGYGLVNREVSQEAEGQRIELEPFALAVADQRVAGVVEDAEARPVADINVAGYGEGQPNASGRTDAKGRFSIDGVCAGPITLQANSRTGGGTVITEGGETNITIQLARSQAVMNSGRGIQVSGTVTDPEGKLAPGVLMSVFPFSSSTRGESQTDGEGRFRLAYTPRQFGPMAEVVPVVVARDAAHNLAAAVELGDEATNVSIRLEPGLTLTGRITDLGGKAITNAQAQVMWQTVRIGLSLGHPSRADAGGRFEIKGLPRGRQYSVSASAKGFGLKQWTVPAEDTGTNRFELEVLSLARADQRLAGVVLDANEKPVAHIEVVGHGEGQPAIRANTDARGRFTLNAVCAGRIGLQANTTDGRFGSVSVESGDTNVTLRLGSVGTMAGSRPGARISGTVTDPEGKPAPRVRVSLFPSYSPVEKQTDDEGHFTLTFNPGQFGFRGAAQPVVVARDLARNLAAAVELEEDATNVSVRLEPALTLAGRIADPKGHSVTNAQARVLLHTERMSSPLGAAVRADSDGKFEVAALPPGREYTINVSAKGYGQEQRNVPASDTATNRLELEPLELTPADQRVAGVVLDDNDKPVARASIYSLGPRQPNGGTQTDAQGRFSLNKVCAGPIQLTANSQGGGYGNVSAEGGDTNIVIHVRNRRLAAVVNREAPQTVRLKGKPLPDLAPLGLTPEQAPAGQPLLAVLVDAEQRPSRRALRLLGEKAAAIKAKGVAVIVVQTGTMTEDDFKAWKQEAALAFPVGSMKGDTEKARAAWGANALPWLILTDKEHRVTAEGFSLEELDAKLNDANP